MILLVLAVLLVVGFLYNSRVFPMVLLIYFVVFDMFDGFYEDNQALSYVRYLVPMGLLGIYCIKNNILKKLDFIFLLLVTYLLLLWITNSGDFLVSSRNLFSLLITLLMLPVGRFVGSRTELLKEFETYNRVLLYLIPLYIVYANIYKIGESYTEAFTTGFLITSRMYVVPIVVFLAIHYAVSNKSKRWWIKGADAAFILMNICMLLINTRRTALGMLAGAIIIYVLLNRKLIFKMLVLVVVVVAGLVASYPLYEARLTAQLEKRARIQDLETYEEEGRYLETMYIIDYHTKKESLAEILFGVKLFDTFSFGNKYFGKGRPIHSDINMILYSTGLVGFILFLLFTLHTFLRGMWSIPLSHRKLYLPLLIMFFMVILPGRFIGTLTFAPLLMFLLAAVKAYRPVYDWEEEHQDYLEESDALLVPHH